MLGQSFELRAAERERWKDKKLGEVGMESELALRVGGVGLAPGRSTGAHQGILSVGVSRSALQVWAPRTVQDRTVVASGALAVGPAARTLLGSHAASALDRGSAPSAAARPPRLLFSARGWAHRSFFLPQRFLTRHVRARRRGCRDHGGLSVKCAGRLRHVVRHGPSNKALKPMAAGRRYCAAAEEPEAPVPAATA